jgi:hypothetical protein
LYSFCYSFFVRSFVDAAAFRFVWIHLRRCHRGAAASGMDSPKTVP